MVFYFFSGIFNIFIGKFCVWKCRVGGYDCVFCIGVSYDIIY